MFDTHLNMYYNHIKYVYKAYNGGGMNNRLTRKLCAEEERKSREQFLTELYLAIKDYFIAKFYCNGEKIYVTLLNGQRFIISVEEE